MLGTRWALLEGVQRADGDGCSVDEYAAANPNDSKSEKVYHFRVKSGKVGLKTRARAPFLRARASLR